MIMSRTSSRINLHSIVCLNVKELLAQSRRHIWRWWWWWYAMMNCFCGMVDRQKAVSVTSSRNHCQISSRSRIFDTTRAGFEPAQKPSSGLLEWSCAVVITTILHYHYTKFCSSDEVHLSYLTLKNSLYTCHQTYSKIWRKAQAFGQRERNISLQVPCGCFDHFWNFLGKHLCWTMKVISSWQTTELWPKKSRAFMESLIDDCVQFSRAIPKFHSWKCMNFIFRFS